MIRKTGSEGKSGQLGAGMRGTMFKGTSTARVSSSMPTELFMRAIFIITRYKVMERTSCTVLKSTLANGSITKCMEKDI